MLSLDDESKILNYIKSLSKITDLVALRKMLNKEFLFIFSEDNVLKYCKILNIEFCKKEKENILNRVVSNNGLQITIRELCIIYEIGFNDILLLYNKSDTNTEFDNRIKKLTNKITSNYLYCESNNINGENYVC